MNYLSLALNLAVLTVLIYLSGLFSGSELALTSLSKADVAKMKINKEKNAELLEILKSDMDRTIVTILVANNLINVTLSALTTRLAYTMLGDLGVSITIGLLTFLLLVFGEITPKGFAVKNRKQFSQKYAKLVYYLSVILIPVIRVLERISESIIGLLGGKTKDQSMEITEEDVKDLAKILAEEGTIKNIEKNLLNRVFWFGDKRAKSVKIPKEKVKFLRAEQSVDEAVDFIRKHKFTRIPVLEKEMDKIRGILYSKDVLGKEDGKVEDYMREPNFVQEEDEITEVFKRMKNNREHMAIVKNGSGEFVGIITLEDILEELVGEIYDEFDEVH